MSVSITELIEWCISRGLSPTSVRAGDCEVTFAPSTQSGSVVPADRGPSSLYDVYAEELVDDAFRAAHGNLPTTSKDDLVPVVTG